MSRKTPIWPLLLPAMIGVLVLAGCGGGGDGTGSSTGAERGAGGGSASKVEIANFMYAPASVEVAMGGSITWTNSDSSPHTATAQGDRGVLDTGTLKQGDSKTITFTSPGTYRYQCLFHPFMHGTVTVTG